MGGEGARALLPAVSEAGPGEPPTAEASPEEVVRGLGEWGDTPSRGHGTSWGVVFLGKKPPSPHAPDVWDPRVTVAVY